MSDENELSPELEAALRDIPAADPALRDQHIAAALGDLAPAATTKRRNLFAAAAAVLVLAGAGFAVSRNSDDTPPALAADTTAVSLPKASGECTAAGTRDDNEEVGSFALGETTFDLFRLNGVIDLYSTSGPCTKVGSIDYWAALEMHTNGTDAPTEGVECGILSEPIVRFSDQSKGMTYSFAIILTTGAVSLYLEDGCNEPLGSIAMPAAGD
jgi:hypothetical protein